MKEISILPHGLTSSEAKERQVKYGKNELTPKGKHHFFGKIIQIISEPMFLLLIVSAIIYFILGEPKDGAVMLVFVIGVISIEVIQEWKTDRTLHALKELSAPKITVIRDGKEMVITSIDLVPGDLMLINEGVKIPADGFIIKSNDLCVDESSLTGESEGVWKKPITSNSVYTTEYSDTSVILKDNDRVNTVQSCSTVPNEYWHKDYCYAGTLVTQGCAFVLVDKIGKDTEYGKIGFHIISAPESPTLLQKQIGSLVRLCAGIAVVLFAAVGFITFNNISNLNLMERIIESILSGITLAMAMIPEEFPVILTVFLSIGAWRLAKQQSLIRRLPSVETLGAVTVLCVDKTGTITLNQMTVQEIWSFTNFDKYLCEFLGLACETDTYDPMEKAILNYCDQNGLSKEHLFSGNLITEYPFTHELKMMGHVWFHEGNIKIAAKGSPESIVSLCNLTEEEQLCIKNKMDEMSKNGLRVIAVAMKILQEDDSIPSCITDCKLSFCGLVALSDPPRESVKEDIFRCTQAGIRVVMITGDNGITASSIAKQVGISNTGKTITGTEIDRMTDNTLKEYVKEVNIFSRVIPEHKMRIVKALKDNGDIVAMTGDGVNDAPALKYADIGIAMGKRGSEVAREASDLILMDDNFSTIVHTIGDGRRIYDNIRKAVGYVFTIHIPIALSALLAPLLNINSANLLLLPLHVVLLELIIDPTCSLVLERQPAETDIMKRKPRKAKDRILTPSILLKSIVQGLVIFLFSFGIYEKTLINSGNAGIARTMGLTLIMFSNLFLVQVNSSQTDFVVQSIKKLAKDKVMWFIHLITLVGVIVMLYTPLSGFLKLAPLSITQFLTVITLSFLSVFWYELVKLVKYLLFIAHKDK